MDPAGLRRAAGTSSGIVNQDAVPDADGEQEPSDCRNSVLDDKAGKPVGINEFIGRRPIAAFGDSDGDLRMLQWTTMSG